MTLVAVIILLSLLIIAHELGHLLTAKLAGVKVEEFGIGFPPRLVGVKIGETVYSLNLLPFGGFVRILGEEEDRGPRSLWVKPIPVRMLVLGSGALMNAILPLFLLAASFMLPRQVTVGEVAVEEVRPGSPAAQAGLMPGDRVLRAGEKELLNHWDLTYAVHLNLGKPLALEVLRDGERRSFTLTPRWKPPPEEGPMGIRVATRNSFTRTLSYPPWEAFPKAARSLVESFQLLRNEVLTWIVGAQTPQVGGPVAIVQLAGEAARAGPGPLLTFAAFISLNLAIINLLPVPGLDGGRLFFVFLEVLRRGRRISPQRERLAHLVGFVLLVALLLVVTYFDLVRALWGEPLP